MALRRRNAPHASAATTAHPRASGGAPAGALPSVGTGGDGGPAARTPPAHSAGATMASPHHKRALGVLLAELAAPPFAGRTAAAAAATALTTPTSAPTDGPGASDGPAAAAAAGEASTPTDVDATVARLTSMMARLGADADANSREGGAAAAMEGVSDEVLASMMREFEAMGTRDDFGAAVDGVMRQLLAPEVMAAPLARLCELVRRGGGWAGGGWVDGGGRC